MMGDDRIPGATWVLIVGIAFLIFISANVSLAQLIDTDHNLTFSWEKPPADDDIAAYIVQYSTDDGNTWSPADTLEASSQQTTFFTLRINQDARITIRVHAVDIAGHNGPFSQQSDFVISDTAPPGAPGQPVYVEEGMEPQGESSSAHNRKTDYARTKS